MTTHRRGRWFRHPAQVVVAAFGTTIVLGSALLSTPLATADGGGAGWLTALFTATSAVCVTGLVVVDTGTHWSLFGQIVILALIQIGGFGVMTMASLLGLLVTHRMGLRTRLTAATETKSLGLGEVSRVLRGVLRVTVLCELVVAVVLSWRFSLGYGEPAGRAIYLGVFHSISAFNNAGFGLYRDSLMQFATDPWVCVPIAVAVILGGLGFPVLLELRREIRRPRRWSLHTRLTVGMTVLLLTAGGLFMTASEWANPLTLGGFAPLERIGVGFFHAVMPRTAGFNSLDVSAMSEETWIGTIVLMFIGGGSAGTAGGIKVTTFVVLLFAIWAEVRGETTINIFDRRLEPRVVRQALTVALLSVAAIVTSTMAIKAMSSHAAIEILFEVTSAFATVGLSTGVTADLPPAAQAILILLMFIGRLGPMTLVSSLALRQRQSRYRHPEGRPIIG